MLSTATGSAAQFLWRRQFGEDPLRGQRCRSFETLTGSHTMQSLQGDLPIVVIIAVAAFLAGLCSERLRVDLARRAWQKKRWSKSGAAPVTDPAEQLSLSHGCEV